MGKYIFETSSLKCCQFWNYLVLSSKSPRLRLHTVFCFFDALLTQHWYFHPTYPASHSDFSTLQPPFLGTTEVPGSTAPFALSTPPWKHHSEAFTLWNWILHCFLLPWTLAHTNLHSIFFQVFQCPCKVKFLSSPDTHVFLLLQSHF